MLSLIEICCFHWYFTLLIFLFILSYFALLSRLYWLTFLCVQASHISKIESFHPGIFSFSLDLNLLSTLLVFVITIIASLLSFPDCINSLYNVATIPLKVLKSEFVITLWSLTWMMFLNFFFVFVISFNCRDSFVNYMLFFFYLAANFLWFCWLITLVQNSER